MSREGVKIGEQGSTKAVGTTRDRSLDSQSNTNDEDAITVVERSALDRQLLQKNRKVKSTSKKTTKEHAAKPSRPHSAVLATDSINTKYVQQQISASLSALPTGFCAVVTKPAENSRRVTLLGPQVSLLKTQFPKGGTLWIGSLVHFLRSGSVLPVIKLFAEKCWDDRTVRAELNKYLPTKDFPWPRQHAEIVELAKLADAGRSIVSSDEDAKLLCAIYARKLLLCNYATLLKNSPDSNAYIASRLLHLPCAVVLTAFHEMRTQTGVGFFATLLGSPLAQAMHAHVREKIEKNYPLDSSLKFGEDPVIFYDPPRHLPSPASETEINTVADYDLEPFNDKEKVRFLMGFRDWPRTDPARAVSDIIDYEYIAEILPGRCVDEIKQYYLLNEASLKVDPVIRPSTKPGKRSRRDGEGSEEESEGAAPLTKKARKAILEEIAELNQGSTDGLDGGAKPSSRRRRPASQDAASSDRNSLLSATHPPDTDSAHHYGPHNSKPGKEASLVQAVHPTVLDPALAKLWRPVAVPAYYADPRVAAGTYSGMDRMARLYPERPEWTRSKNVFALKKSAAPPVDQGQVRPKAVRSYPQGTTKTSGTEVFVPDPDILQYPMGRKLLGELRAQQALKVEARRAYDEAKAAMKEKALKLKDTSAGNSEMRQIRRANCEKAKKVFSEKKDELESLQSRVYAMTADLKAKQRRFRETKEAAAASEGVVVGSVNEASSTTKGTGVNQAENVIEVEDSDDDMLAIMRASRA